MTESSYTVSGMTCGHCASAVREELGKIAGVRRIDVDAATGRVTVGSETPLSQQDVRAAVDEAGYVLAAT